MSSLFNVNHTVMENTEDVFCSGPRAPVHILNVNFLYSPPAPSFFPPLFLYFLFKRGKILEEIRRKN